MCMAVLSGSPDPSRRLSLAGGPRSKHFRAVGPCARARLCRMFWRKRKAEQERAAAPSRPAGRPPSAPKPNPESDHSTQFLTGDSDVDRRTVEVLLRIIARVSESRDLDPLLTDIVDYSVELTEAERGFLILMDGDGQPYIRVARGPDKREVKEDLRFSRSIVRGVLETQEPKLATVQNDADAL